jgi:CRP-like cAMP-binding protein
MNRRRNSSRSTEGSFRHDLALALRGARPGSVDRLANLARMETIATGETIYLQGDSARLTFVLDGHAALRRTTADGRQFLLGIARPGSLFGLSGIAEQAATTDVVAVSPLSVASWTARDVRRLVLTDPDVALATVDALGRSTVTLTCRFDAFLHRDARRRVLGVLAEYGDLFFGDPPILPRRLLPPLVGTSREMTGRVLRTLEREGVVKRVGRSGLALLAPDLLQDALEPWGDDLAVQPPGPLGSSVVAAPDPANVGGQPRIGRSCIP